MLFNSLVETLFKLVVRLASVFGVQVAAVILSITSRSFPFTRFSTSSSSKTNSSQASLLQKASPERKRLK